MSTPSPSTPAAPIPAVPAPPRGDPAQGHAPPPPPPGGRAARLIVVLCFAIATLATALIYWRWANVSEPTSYLIVQGTEEHNGTVITVSTDRAGEVVVMETLKSDNQYAVTIFLHPGTYWLHAAQSGTTLVEGNLLVGHRRQLTVQLQSKRPPGSARGDKPPAAGVS